MAALLFEGQDASLTNAQKRSLRLSAARKKGTHSKKDWIEMKVFFENTCASCFGESGLINVEKDHIIPVYQGGSDGIDNIQPLCALCNSRKGRDNTDLRPQLSFFLKKELPVKYTVKRTND